MQLRFKKLDMLVDQLFENYRNYVPQIVVDDFRDNFVNYQNNIKQYHSFFKVIVNLQGLRDKLFRDNKYQDSQFEDVQMKIADLVEQSNEIFTQIEFFYTLIKDKEEFETKDKENFEQANKSRNVIMKRQKIFENIFDKEDEEIIIIQQQFKENWEKQEAKKNQGFEDESYDEDEESEPEEEVINEGNQDEQQQVQLGQSQRVKEQEFEYQITQDEMDILDQFAEFDQQLVIQKG